MTAPTIASELELATRMIVAEYPDCRVVYHDHDQVRPDEEDYESEEEDYQAEDCVVHVFDSRVQVGVQIAALYLGYQLDLITRVHRRRISVRSDAPGMAILDVTVERLRRLLRLGELALRIQEALALEATDAPAAPKDPHIYPATTIWDHIAAETTPTTSL